MEIEVTVLDDGCEYVIFKEGCKGLSVGLAHDVLGLEFDGCGEFGTPLLETEVTVGDDG